MAFLPTRYPRPLSTSPTMQCGMLLRLFFWCPRGVFPSLMAQPLDSSRGLRKTEEIRQGRSAEPSTGPKGFVWRPTTHGETPSADDVRRLRDTARDFVGYCRSLL